MNWPVIEAAALMGGISLLSFGIGYLFGANRPVRRDEHEESIIERHYGLEDLTIPSFDVDLSE